MEKINNRHLNLLGCSFLLSAFAFSQAKSGMENYNFLRPERNYQWMPVIHFQSGKGAYAEIRYNYEDDETISFFAGRSFSTGQQFQITVTPMLGISAGRFKGLSLGANADAEWKNWFVSTQMQFSKSFSKTNGDFFFCWTEAGLNFSGSFFAGPAFQFTRQSGLSEFEPGMLAGFSFGNVTIPFYLFRVFSRDQYIILGVNYEYQFGKKRMNKEKSMYLD